MHRSPSTLARYGCSPSLLHVEEYLFCAVEMSSLAALCLSFSLLALPRVPLPLVRPGHLLLLFLLSRRGEAAPRASRCFICLSALFITCNLALARARIISYWFSAPLPLGSPEPSPLPSSPPLSLLPVASSSSSSSLLLLRLSASLVGAERARLRARSAPIVMRARNVVRRRNGLMINRTRNIVVFIATIIRGSHAIARISRHAFRSNSIKIDAI